MFIKSKRLSAFSQKNLLVIKRSIFRVFLREKQCSHRDVAFFNIHLVYIFLNNDSLSHKNFNLISQKKSIKTSSTKQSTLFECHKNAFLEHNAKLNDNYLGNSFDLNNEF